LNPRKHLNLDLGEKWYEELGMRRGHRSGPGAKKSIFTLFLEFISTGSNLRGVVK